MPISSVPILVYLSIYISSSLYSFDTEEFTAKELYVFAEGDFGHSINTIGKFASGKTTLGYKVVDKLKEK